MESKRNLLILALMFITLNVYLFASAPAPLPDKVPAAGGMALPVEKAFVLLAQENDAVRSLYTRSIIGTGQKADLQFREDWKEKDVEAGPLPALFLRSTAAYLEKDPLPLSLFLGSDFPISTANKFSGIQEKYFAEMKKDKQPKYFFDDNTQKYTAMFPDVASVNTCVSCHNEHPDSPKKDWQLGDMMGATTWSFPDDSVSVEKIAQILALYRRGARHTYSTYLEKASNFSNTKKPRIGNEWPSQGYSLPTAEVFMDSVSAIASPKTLNLLLLQLEKNDKGI